MTSPLDPREEQRLRDLLDHATSDVEPTHGLDAIQNRTKVSPMSARPWFVGTAAAVLATAATLTAVAVMGNDATTNTADPQPADTPTSTADSPTVEEEQPTPSTQSPEPQPVEAAVPVYYVGDTGRGPRLYREFHPGIGGDTLDQAVSDAVSRTPDDPDYESPWPQGTRADSAFSGGPDGELKVTVDRPGGDSLRERPAGMSRATAEMAVQQLVYTAQAAAQTTAPVLMLLGGERVDQLLGVPVNEPLARGDEAATLAQVWIIEPGNGLAVGRSFEVSGVGAFFEANVVWELHQGDATGRVITSSAQAGPVTAEECCTMAPYSFTVDVPGNAPPGDYTLLVTDSDPSGGEGFPPFGDTKQLTIE